MELFRINSGRAIILRKWNPHRTRFDIVTYRYSGLVKAKALNPATYKSPNGASMRPNSPAMGHIRGSFRDNDLLIYSVPAGTLLPPDLLLVHEYRDYYSLQSAKDMSLQDLNYKITTFLETHGQFWTKEAWLKIYKSAASASRT